MKNIKDTLLYEFREKLKELKHDDNFDENGETAIHEFGQRVKASDGYVWTIVDWGRIESFLLNALERVEKEAKEEEDRFIGTMYGPYFEKIREEERLRIASLPEMEEEVESWTHMTIPCHDERKAARNALRRELKKKLL